jgi:hypothetical protein
MSESAKETFERLRGEMNLGRPLYLKKREEVEQLDDEWFARMFIDRERFMAVIDARERMEAEESGATKNTQLHPIWAAANERLLARRSSNGGERAHL